MSPADRHPGVPERPRTLLLPGFVNAHSHAFQRAFRGQVQWAPEGRGDFWTWRQRMYACANGLDPDGVFAVSRLAFLEMVEAGFTAVGEFHYLHRDPSGKPYADPDELARRVIAAAEDVGMRIRLLRVIYAAGGIGIPLQADQQRFRTDSVEEAVAAAERLGGGLAPHSVRAVPLAWWPEIAAYQGLVHVHLSEQPAEVEAALAATGKTPVGIVSDVLSPRFTAVHLTHPRGDDLDRMRVAGARIAVCPTTELDLGDGFLPVEALDLPLCIGSDSHAAIDPFRELRALELHARAQSGRRLVLGTAGDRHSLAERLLHIGTNGACLDFESGIAVGKPADLVLLDLDRPAAVGQPPLEAAVFSADPSWVQDVWVAGRRIVEAGRHPRRQEIVSAALSFMQ